MFTFEKLKQANTSSCIEQMIPITHYRNINSVHYVVTKYDSFFFPLVAENTNSG